MRLRHAVVDEAGAAGLVGPGRATRTWAPDAGGGPAPQVSRYQGRPSTGAEGSPGEVAPTGRKARWETARMPPARTLRPRTLLCRTPSERQGCDRRGTPSSRAHRPLWTVGHPQFVDADPVPPVHVHSDTSSGQDGAPGSWTVLSHRREGRPAITAGHGRNSVLHARPAAGKRPAEPGPGPGRHVARAGGERGGGGVLGAVGPDEERPTTPLATPCACAGSSTLAPAAAPRARTRPSVAA